MCDGASFEAWWRAAPPRVLARMQMAHAAPFSGAEPVDAHALERRFPARLDVSGLQLALDYRFRPGDADDGVTVQLPRELLAAVNAGDMEWGVPGLQHEKVVALLKVLPKAMRRRLGPAPDVAAEFLASAPQDAAGSERGLVSALARFLDTRFGVTVGDELWSPERLDRRLPAHLRLRYRLLEGDGTVLAEDRDLERLKRRFARGAGREAPAAVRDGHRRWDFGALAQSVTVERGGTRGLLYPALVVHGDGVSVESIEDLERARRLHAAGLVQLAMAEEGIEPDRLAREVPQRERLGLLEALLPPPPLAAPGAADPGGARIAVDVARAAVADAWRAEDPWSVRDAAAFAAFRAAGRPRLASSLQQVAAQALDVLERHHALRVRLEAGGWPEAWQPNLDDVREQLRWLVYRGFLPATPHAQRPRLAAYLEAASRRLDKLARGGARDTDKLAELRPAWERYVARARAHAARGHEDPALMRYRWLLEEFRISLFCQELGTAERVSRQRLDRSWAAVAA